MEDEARDFLTDLLETPSPAGFETNGQRRWIDYVDAFADDVWTDDYGNAVAVLEGDSSGGDGESSDAGGGGDDTVDGNVPEIVLTGHADEIGYVVKRIDGDGFVRPGRIGGSDPSVARGQHVTIHAATGPVDGVIGQDAIHVRDDDGDPEVDDLWIDVGADDEEDARERLEVGDPITFASTFSWLGENRLAGRGIDNRVGTWAAAEGLRRAAEADVEATVYAVSTVQEELGKRGAEMISFELEPDAVVAVDVTHAVDYPGGATDNGIELGAGPVVARGSSNHPVVCQAVRRAAEEAGIDVQLQATGTATGTDADAFFTARGGVPSQVVSVPNRYMHTPVELIDVADLEAVADALAAFAGQAHEYDSFAVDV